jgi:hypothetical protein
LITCGIPSASVLAESFLKMGLVQLLVAGFAAGVAAVPGRRWDNKTSSVKRTILKEEVVAGADEQNRKRSRFLSIPTLTTKVSVSFPGKPISTS